MDQGESVMAKKTKKALEDQIQQSAPSDEEEALEQDEGSEDFDEVELEQLEPIIESALGRLKSTRADLSWLNKMSTERRKVSRGKFRDGESPILLSVAEMTAQKKRKAFFKPLAKKDKGQKPGAFESALLIRRLKRRELYLALLKEVEELAIRLSDTILYEGEYSKPVLLKAYSLARKAAEDDEDMRTDLADAIDFYGEPAKKALRTKARKEAEKATKAAEKDAE
jgi:hypothetical protein